MMRTTAGRLAGLTRKPLVGALLAGALTLGIAQPAWATWSPQNPPSPPINAQLNAVSCMTPTDCVTVGSYANASGTYALAETSSGSTWTEANPANLPGATNTTLDAISCTPTWCLAVGTTSAGGPVSPLAELWNGSSWAAQSVPSPFSSLYADLYGVWCSAGGCEVVGSYTTNAGTFPLADAWNGSSWSMQSAPNPSGSTNSQLNAVSCTALGSCVAVGEQQGATDTLSLGEGLSGTTWSIQTTVNPPGFNLNDLTGISCPTSSMCVAVGTGLTEVSHSGVWTYVKAVKPPGDTGGAPNFGGVSCPTANQCMAAGTYYDQSINTATSEIFNGTSWKTEGMLVADSTTSFLNGVACTAANQCIGVGNWQDSVTLDYMTLVQGYSLAWQAQGVPNENGSITSSLTSPNCASYCTVAQNVVTTNGSTEGYIAFGSGTTGWSYRTTPNLNDIEFNGLWCDSTGGHCVVVGEGQGPSPLTEVFNGVQFTQVSAPMPSVATDAGFYSVSCTSPTACLAVGFYDQSDNEYALAEQWNGTTWTIVTPTMPAGSTYSMFNGVSCSGTTCVAVGNYGASGGTQQALVYVLSGSTWTNDSIALPAGSSDPVLNAVSCHVATACEAVGSVFNGSVVPLALHWNGTTWSAKVTPAPSGSANASLIGVTCTGANACVGVGTWYDSSFDSYVLAEGLSGGSWNIQNTTSTGATNSELVGVSCPSASSCTAVGNMSGPNPESELVEQYT